MTCFRGARGARVALAAAALAAVAGTVPAHATLGESITCTGTLTSVSRVPWNGGWNANGSATCTVLDNDSPTGLTVSGVGMYASGGLCVLGGVTFVFTAGGHSYYTSYYGTGPLGSGVEGGVLLSAGKDGGNYYLTQPSPMAGTVVIGDTRVPTGLCAGYVEPVQTLAFSFNAAVAAF
jgi:hypothetical protein